MIAKAVKRQIRKLIP